MNWQLKGRIQGGLSVIPLGSHCNYFLQRTVGSLASDTRVDHTFEEDVTVLLERIAWLGLDPAKLRILEIGTGWLPVLPLSLALAGFQCIFTADLYPHLREAAIRRTLLALEKHLGHPAFRPFATPDSLCRNFERLKKTDAIFPAAGIEYSAPCNAGATKWCANSMDLILSNNVLEHVPVAGLMTLFAEAKRLLRPGGYALHCVNCGDHYAYADKAITQINYLRFPERDWQRWNNSIHFQNRLRPIDFMEMAENAKLRVESAEFFPRPEYLCQLQAMEVAPEFRHYSHEQLASTSLTLLASA